MQAEGEQATKDWDLIECVEAVGEQWLQEFELLESAIIGSDLGSLFLMKRC